MLLGLEIDPLFDAFLREKNIIIRSMAHPVLFTMPETSRREISHFDFIPLFGALPVSPINMYRLLSRNSFVLLYPGGAREAFHRKVSQVTGISVKFKSIINFYALLKIFVYLTTFVLMKISVHVSRLTHLEPANAAKYPF